MDEFLAFRASRALWLALVAIALGIAWFLCGGANSASATTLLPDTPPAADASASDSAPVTVAVPAVLTVAEAVPSLPAEPAAAPVARAESLPAQPVVADTAPDTAPDIAPLADEGVASGIDPLVTVIETAGEPIVESLLAQTTTVTIATVALPTVTIPTVALPTVSIPTVTIPTVIPTVTIPTAALPAMGIPAVTASSATFAQISNVRPSVFVTLGSRDVSGAVASLTPPDAAASAAETPLGTPGHPINLPQPTPEAAVPSGGGAVSLLPTCGSARDASALGARLIPEDDTLPSSLATDPGSSPA